MRDGRHSLARSAARTVGKLLSAATVLAVLGVLTVCMTMAAASPVARRSMTRPAGKIVPFRVDVSRYPKVGLVATVPAALHPPARRDFTVITGNRVVHPSVRQLSPNNLELVVAADGQLAPAQLQAERASGARFLVGLPTGARTSVVSPLRPALSPRDLSADPAPSVGRMAALAHETARPAAARLAAALAGFSGGPRVRRTVVLVVSSGRGLTATAGSRYRQQLAASGTALYVLDASPGGAPAYDALAAGSGGFSIRLRAPGGWPTAFKQITTDLSRQYYLRFTDTTPLPSRIRILVRTQKGVTRGAADLPIANPDPPPPPPPPPLPLTRPVTGHPHWDRPLVWLAALLIVFGVGYSLVMLAVSRREPGKAARRKVTAVARPPAAAGEELFFVFLLPCLNEEKVIGNSLERLLSLPGGHQFAILVIDDGSDDGTVAAVSAFLGDRVWLLRREPPFARQGKGEALNAAIRCLTGGPLLAGRDPDKVIVVVVDADGRLDSHAITSVSPYFTDPSTGAVQIGVRINNRDRSGLARMQDMEFVIYTEVFQRGRRHLGSVGLGGNGQFVRLSALLSLGPAPWTRSLTDDLDLGVRLISEGWRNEYCPAAAVHQQGVVQLRRLIRQRSRWFQGHLQSWKLIPVVLRSAPRRARADMLYHLSSPAILLIASLLSASFLLSIANSALLAAEGRNPFGLWLASTYALTFFPALIYGYVYWLRERGSGVPLFKVAGLAHLYVLYGMMWYAAGWWAVGRTLRGRTGWAKTDRTAEAPLAQPAPAAAGGIAASRPLVPATAGGIAASRPLVPATAGGIAASRPLVPAAAGIVTSRPLVPASPGMPSGLAALVSLAAGQEAVRDAAPHRGGANPGFPPPQPYSAPGRPASASRPVGGRRRRLVAAASAVVLACAVSGVLVARTGLFGGQTVSKQWQTVFNGYGQVSVTGSGADPVVVLSPRSARTPADTHAALVISTTGYGDFAASVRVRTISQLRHGAAGGPHPWEVGWVVWHYTSNKHFYALTLEPTGWVLSKQDPSYPGSERFLASGRLPWFRVGVPHRVGIVQIGNRITVSGDGHLLAHYTDRQHPYLTGTAGLYCEDSLARFDHIHINRLPAQPEGT
jgi:1,2-diacylglycerol 3-beta-glucosyltransferase